MLSYYKVTQYLASHILSHVLNLASITCTRFKRVTYIGHNAECNSVSNYTVFHLIWPTYIK